MKNIVFLTGAGISAESGIPTFRGDKGMWEKYNVKQMSSIEGWKLNPELMLDFYNERRQDLLKVEPNDAHKAIAKLQDKYNVTVITQNVDDLHERAGSQNVLHLHGELKKVCSSAQKETCIKEVPLEVPLRIGDKADDGSQLRPYVVWFGEPVPNFEKACDIIKQADIFVIIGSSLNVTPANSLVKYSNAKENYIIDPLIKNVYEFESGKHQSLEDAIPNIHIINLPATKGMNVLQRELGV